MLNLEYSSSGVTTQAIWPEVSSSYANNPSGSFVLTLSQEYDRSETELTGTLLNNPTPITPRLILQFNRSQLPEYSGQYTAELKEGLVRRYKWGTTNVKWSEANWIWNTATQLTEARVLDIDRAWVSGSDFATFDVYTSSSTETIYDSGSAYPATEYVSPDENGTYTTYHV